MAESKNSETVDQKTSEDKYKQLTQNLNKFLTFKYYMNNVELSKELERSFWEETFTDWKAIRDILSYKPTPDPKKFYREDPKRGITVILPKNDLDLKENFRLLKGAAYFPYQLDPKNFHDFIYDEDILIQLAYATHYGYWAARDFLGDLKDRFRLVGDHPLTRHREDLPRYNENDMYYELKLPEQYWNNSSTCKDNLPFDPKTDFNQLKSFLDCLLEIAQNGTRPKEMKS